MRTLLVATTNPESCARFARSCRTRPSGSSSLADIPPIEEPEETGATFEENARLKARHYAVATAGCGLWRKIPGSSSMRSTASQASGQPVFSVPTRRTRNDSPKSSAALMRSRPATTARFVGGARQRRPRQNVIYETTGVVEGEIADAPRGRGGFGYDPIFFYPPYGRTLAEVSERKRSRVAASRRRISEVCRLAERRKNDERRTMCCSPFVTQSLAADDVSVRGSRAGRFGRSVLRLVR